MAFPRRGGVLDYLRLTNGVARGAPELQDVPAQLVGQAQDAADDRIGGACRATTGSGAAAEDQTPQSQDAFAGLPSIRSPRAARRADLTDELRPSDPVWVFHSLVNPDPPYNRPSTTQSLHRNFDRLAIPDGIQRRSGP